MLFNYLNSNKKAKEVFHNKHKWSKSGINQGIKKVEQTLSIKSDTNTDKGSGSCQFYSHVFLLGIEYRLVWVTCEKSNIIWINESYF